MSDAAAVLAMARTIPLQNAAEVIVDLDRVKDNTVEARLDGLSAAVEPCA